MTIDCLFVQMINMVDIFHICVQIGYISYRSFPPDKLMFDRLVRHFYICDSISTERVHFLEQNDYSGDNPLGEAVHNRKKNYPCSY